MPVYSLGGLAPEIDPDAWVAPGSQVMGSVTLAAAASVWYGAVLRGDNAAISIGERSNIQDVSVLHTDEGFPLSIGADVTVGHRAILHGCTIEDACLIGMGATVMNGAVVGSGSLVGAGALVTERTVVPPGSLVLGAPAKVVKTLDEGARERILASAAHYVSQSAKHRGGLVELR
ncbi:MAG: gamma carbonic anhydrase family protein [Pseudomonadota bacterium]